MKRMACQIAAQLPDEREEALGVLNYVRDIVLNLGGGWGERDAAWGVAPSPKPSALLYVIPTTNPAGSQGAETAAQIDRPDIASRE
jgi:hypothetical protein